MCRIPKEGKIRFLLFLCLCVWVRWMEVPFLQKCWENFDFVGVLSRWIKSDKNKARMNVCASSVLTYVCVCNRSCSPRWKYHFWLWNLLSTSHQLTKQQHFSRIKTMNRNYSIHIWSEYIFDLAYEKRREKMSVSFLPLSTSVHSSILFPTPPPPRPPPQ